MGDPHTEILAVTWAGAQWDAIEGIKQFPVETGIGYRVAKADYRVYESYAWLHMQLGEAGHFDGAKWYWGVIPNAFEVADFTYSDKVGEDFIYLGRLNADKGVGLAIQAAKSAGRRITICGQGDPEPFLRGQDHVTYLPPVGVDARRKLLSEARAVFCLSHYVEPFCGVHMEAMLSGTPVITTDWGVFPETVLHGVTGYRCRTFEQMEWAAKHVPELDRQATRLWAERNFSLERVALQYEEFFQQVLSVRSSTHPVTEGFYSAYPNRTQLEWLRRSYPTDPETGCSNLDALFDTESPHVPPPVPEPVTEWKEAQDWERDWWGLTWNARWDEEIAKQEDYFRLMGAPAPLNGWRDFGDKAILDVGCGPVSMLQRSLHGRSRGVDPLAVSAETIERYVSSDVEFLNIKAEDMPTMGPRGEGTLFDEVWGYNVLQHTEDPNAILHKVCGLGKAVRIFEWLHVGKCPGHPQDLTEALFAQHFSDALWDKKIWNVGTMRDPDHGHVTQYLAVYAVRR